MTTRTRFGCPREDGSFGWLDRANLTSDVNAVVTLETVYVRRAQNLTDQDGNPTGPWCSGARPPTVTGYRDWRRTAAWPITRRRGLHPRPVCPPDGGGGRRGL